MHKPKTVVEAKANDYVQEIVNIIDYSSKSIADEPFIAFIYTKKPDWFSEDVLDAVYEVNDNGGKTLLLNLSLTISRELILTWDRTKYHTTATAQGNLIMYGIIDETCLILLSLDNNPRSSINVWHDFNIDEDELRPVTSRSSLLSHALEESIQNQKRTLFVLAIVVIEGTLIGMTKLFFVR